MSEDKNFVQDEFSVNNDTDYAQSVEGLADDNYDGDADSAEERTESYTEEIEKVLKSANVPAKKSKLSTLSKTTVAVISCVATLVVCIVVAAIVYGVSYNKYNSNKDGYLPTLSDLANENSMDLKRIKQVYGLPDNMRGDTIVAIALNYMPAGLYVELNYGMPFDMAVAAMGLQNDERISADMRYGDYLKILNEIEVDALTEGSKDEAPPAEGEPSPAEDEAHLAESESAPAENK